MIEIYSKTSASETSAKRRLRRPGAARLRSSSSSLSRICGAYREISAADCKFCRGSLQSVLRFSAWLHRNRCQTGYLQGGPRFPARPCREDGRWLCPLDWGGLRSLEGIGRRVLLRSPKELHEVIAREGLLLLLTQSSNGNLGVMPGLYAI